MHWSIRALAMALGAVSAQGATPSRQHAWAQAAPAGLTVPFEFDSLPNGLRVVLSRDTTAPVVAVGVYYHIGFRNEPRDRTGFAHLFEHLMFQGSANLGKMEFTKLVQSNGGFNNGSTRFDFTNYYQVVPAHALEPILWAEADRMRGLVIDSTNLRNQQDVVKNEVRVNVLNQPYGGFPWIDLPMAANTNWYNAHNFYGDLADLEAATLADADAFFDRYYAPNNAVIVVVGDFQPAQAGNWIRKYFSSVPRAQVPPPPDISEPRQLAEKRKGRVDSLATRPALAVGWHMPARWTREWFAMGLIDQILAQGRDARFHEAIVQQRGWAGDINAGINAALGNQFNYEGPMLWMAWLFHDATVPPDSILAVIDHEVATLQRTRVDAATLGRARTKMRSAIYDIMDAQLGLGKLDLLASFTLFDNDPGRINQLEAGFQKVTPEDIQRAAREYLRTDNRTVYLIEPGARSASGAN